MSKINWRAIYPAEQKVKQYMGTLAFSKTDVRWRKYCQRNCKGFKAVRLAGYLTGIGLTH